jgi:hypothetical protein
VAKSDLEWAAAQVGPASQKRATLLDHPKISEWFSEAIALRETKGWTLIHIAKVLTALARREKIIPPDSAISDYQVRRWAAKRVS